MVVNFIIAVHPGISKISGFFVHTESCSVPLFKAFTRTQKKVDPKRECALQVCSCFISSFAPVSVLLTAAIKAA